jgi:hypothetical protein
MIGSLAGLADPAIAALAGRCRCNNTVPGAAAVPKPLSTPHRPINRPSTRPQASQGRRGRQVQPCAAISAHPAPENALHQPSWRGIPYAECHYYFDSLYFLSEMPLGSHDCYWLETQCKRFKVFKDGEVVYDKRGRKRIIRVYPPYRFLIEVHVPDRQAVARRLPDREALELLVRYPLKLIAAHPARDFTFDHEQDKLAMLDLFDRCWRQPYQREERNSIRFELGGSTGRRPKGRYDTWYASKECRIDGIVECFHQDGRELGSATLRRIGLGESLNLLDFDHAGYWDKKDQSSLRDIDIKRLGQYHRNRQRKSRSRQAHAQDQRLGGLIFRIHAIEPDGNFSIRQFIKNYGNGPYVGKPMK